jgi:pSer/pThr/pTyr-binding forkhead associated (FHA) protein
MAPVAPARAAQPPARPRPEPERAPAAAATRVTPRPAQAQAPAPYLEVAGTRVVLRGQRTVIGRGLEADLRLDDPGVSRRHAEVRVQGAHGVVSDLGSTNGVVVAGERVDEALLEDGTRFELGSTSIVFRAPAAAPTASGA